MEAFQSSSLRDNRLTILFLFFLPFLIVRCATVAKNESPTKWGWAAVTMPGIQLGEGKTSAHVVLAYDRIKFDGGHNNIWQIGAQIRQSFAPKPDLNGIWIAGEATYLAISNKYDGYSSLKQTASGFTIGPLVGYRFKIGTIPLSVYLAPAFLSRGKFKNNGMAYGEGHTGFLGRFGFDIHYASLLSKKGR